jgi:putative transposase
VILEPDRETARTLRQWMGVCRLTYNTALSYIRDGKQHKKNFYWLRNRFVNASNIPPSKGFILDVPKHVREGAVKDLATAFKGNFTKKSNDPRHTFCIRFRSKKDIQSIVIPKANVRVAPSGLVIYPRSLSSKPIHTHRAIPQPQADCRLSLDRLGRWILYVPVQVETHRAAGESQASDACSLDPGVRTFLTSWSPNGEAYKLGDGFQTTLYAGLLQMDALQGRVATSSGRSKKRKSTALARYRTRHENVLRDLHYQLASFLCARYKTIVIPAFGSKKMTSSAERRLRTKTVRSMLGLGHYAFRQRLHDVAERKGVRVFECTEEYTSKTCSCCGWLHPTLGSAKTFKCGSCDNVIDRDLQGAFNIFLKFEKENSGLLSARGHPR